LFTQITLGRWASFRQIFRRHGFLLSFPLGR
jgi:hypothetical protein